MQKVINFALLFAAVATASPVHREALWEAGSKNAVNCTVSVRDASLTSSVNYLTLTGTSVYSNADCFASDVQVRPATFLEVYTKGQTKLTDALDKVHQGNYCSIIIPNWFYPVHKDQELELYLPLTQYTLIDCSQGKDSPAPIATQSSSKTSHARPSKATKSHSATHKSSSTTTTTRRSTTTHKSKTRTTTATTTTTTTTHKPTTTHKTTTTTKHKTTTTTTTTHKPKPTHDGGDGGDNGRDWVNGKVTFFTPDQGACGWWDNDHSMIAALGPGIYGSMNSKSKYCGRKIEIIGPKGNKITVQVADGCPECAPNHLDLSPAAFAKLGDFNTGILKVKWSFV
ncbi:hypothetical protein DFQ28_010277 [Apophysomyces sp. BC1034]|nr:hypothetical protein DFQ30_009874 [Apophysomyces sp. BC1015]KAG0171573.1 hypothetical protein DFQ29_008768 [Apophysomyces sp. BC1021]KAG0184898.1 hypothetical protein DFQ28_010277 [Apophysomyces sp. BC1034]